MIRYWIHRTQVLIVIFFLLASFQTPKAHSAEVLYEISVPIQLMAMTPEVKYLVIKWAILEGFDVLFEKKEVIPVELDVLGNFFKTLKFIVYDNDIPASSKTQNFVINMELSQDGFISYKPNTPGKPWTKTEPGSMLTAHYILGNLQDGPPYESL